MLNLLWEKKKNSNMALLYISGFAIHVTLFPKISQFLLLFSSEIL